MLRKAAGGFREITSPGTDTFHPRSFKHMGDEALRGAEEMFKIMDTIGACPGDAKLIVNALIPKPTGGNRPIWLCSALFRMWGATRKHIIRE